MAFLLLLTHLWSPSVSCFAGIHAGIQLFSQHRIPGWVLASQNSTENQQQHLGEAEEPVCSLTEEVRARRVSASSKPASPEMMLCAVKPLGEGLCFSVLLL